MPARSKAQQKAAGAALAAKRGNTKVSDLADASRSMYDSMTEDELEDLASTSHEDLPETKADEVSAAGQARASGHHAARRVLRD